MLQKATVWQHVCPAEKALLAVGDAQPCNWCGGHQPPGAFTALIAPTPKPELVIL